MIIGYAKTGEDEQGYNDEKEDVSQEMQNSEGIHSAHSSDETFVDISVV